MTNPNQESSQQPTFSVPPVNLGSGTAMPYLTPAVLATGSDSAGFDAENYRDTFVNSAYDLTGLSVEAADGRVGKVAKASNTLDDGYLMVDTGPWIFGRTVTLPAGVVNHIDRAAGVVYLDVTKEQVKAGPDIDASNGLDDESRQKLTDHYGRAYDRSQAQAAVPTPTDDSDPAA
jgi:hypothetical protein